MTENDYINVKALGHISSALASLRFVTPEIVEPIDTFRFREALNILSNAEQDLFNKINCKT